MLSTPTNHSTSTFHHLPPTGFETLPTLPPPPPKNGFSGFGGFQETPEVVVSKAACPKFDNSVQRVHLRPASDPPTPQEAELSSTEPTTNKKFHEEVVGLVGWWGVVVDFFGGGICL